jgi:hypothetical protein
MPLVKGPYNYLADDNSEWTVVIDAAIGAQAIFGFATHDPTHPVLKSNDRSFKMRHCLVIASNGKKYRVPCGTAAATAYVTNGTACTVHQARDDTALVGRTYGYEGERRRFAIGSAPTQT